MERLQPVESDGPIETAAVGGNVSDERKIVRIVRHLARLDMDALAVQETHWFGCEKYRVEGAEVIMSGRPVPAEGQSCGEVRVSPSY